MPSGYYERRPVADRFRSKYFINESGCWIWIGSIVGSGYGQIRIDGVNVYAHRFSYEQKHGKIPKGLEMDHICRVRNCVNPDHVEPVTHKENVIRGYISRENEYVAI